MSSHAGSSAGGPRRQDLAIRYTDRLADAGIEPSVGSRGDAYDNALAETIIGLFKTEVIYHLGPWKGLEDVEFATLEWVAVYNRQRLMEPLGLYPAGEVRGAVPPCPGRLPDFGTQLTEPPENPGRFNQLSDELNGLS